MVARKGINAAAPSVEAVLESLAHLINRLEPVASRDMMARLWGVRRYVVRQYETDHSDGEVDR